MEQTILTENQKKVLGLFAEHKDLANMFYLTGGTALAEYYLQHRYSDDLDFFTEEKEFPQFAVEAFVETARKTFALQEVTYRRLYDRRMYFLREKSGSELKMEFTYYPFLRISPKPPKNGIVIDSLHDIAANKMHALLNRLEAKDFADLYFLMQKPEFSPLALLDLSKQKFRLTIDPVTLGSEFAKVRVLTDVPRMIKALSLDELKSFFADRARELDSSIFA